MQIAKADTGRILKLSGALRIHVGDELRAALLDYVGTASKPVVDLSEVTECDTTGLQLLIAASRTAEHSGKPFELVGVPVAVREAGVALGLTVTAASPDAVPGRPQDVLDADPVNRGSEDVT